MSKRYRDELTDAMPTVHERKTQTNLPAASPDLVSSHSEAKLSPPGRSPSPIIEKSTKCKHAFASTPDHPGKALALAKRRKKLKLPKPSPSSSPCLLPSKAGPDQASYKNGPTTHPLQRISTPDHGSNKHASLGIPPDTDSNTPVASNVSQKSECGIGRLVFGMDSPTKDDPRSSVGAKELLADLREEKNPTAVAKKLQSLGHWISSQGNDKNQNSEQAHQMGAPSIVMRVMQQFRSNAAVQTQGCFCLQVLLPATIILDLGGMVVIADAMKSFPNDLAVQGAAFGALASVFVFMGSVVGTANCFVNCFVQELDGIGMVVDTMTKFLHSAQIQWFGCSLLGGLASVDNDLIQSALVDSGAVAAVHAAYNKYHVENESVAHQAICCDKLLRGCRE